MTSAGLEVVRPQRLSALLGGVSHRALAAALIGLMAGFPVRAQQLPTGGNVTAGSASIAQPNANTLNINQSTNQAIINWQSFSVGQGATVNFNQPSSSSSTLNRVLGTTPSSIAGQINAPGTVLLINPNGIAITPTGVVNVGSFAASTLNIKDSDYLSGNYKFTGNGGSAAVTNAGRINVSDGGFAALLGGQVSNSGTISARLGKVGLGAGEMVTLDFAGDGFLSVAVPSSQLGNLVDPNGALVSNSGKIRANGGQVFLSAATAHTLLRDAVNVPGSIRANSVGTRNGRIVIGGAAGGKVNVTGKLAAKSKTGKGGEIAVTGKNITLAAATVDVSGVTGGGTVNIGGGRQGQGSLQRAETVTIDSATKIKADAKTTGNGGSVTVWSDALTTFAGTISARGGALSGNGGEAEVSGKAKLAYTGFTDLSATNGAFGTLLLDPYNITISTGADSNQTGFTATGDDSVINVNTLQTALAGANVTISTGASGTQNGDITVANAVTWSANTALTLNAARNISFNDNVTATGASAGLVMTYGGGYSIASGKSVTLSGASSTLSINGNAYTLIRDAAGLQAINSGLSSRYALANDFDLNTPNWAPLGVFSGTLAGLGHTVSNLNINTSASSVGLFSGSFGTIRDLTISGGTVSGADYVGALVGQYSGYFGGKITNVAAVGVNVSGASFVGGLIGFASGSPVGGPGLQGAVSQSYATGSVTGLYGSIGGLIGAANNSTLSQVYATGSVTSTNTGSRIGGLVGELSSSTILNSYATGAVTSTSSSAQQIGGLAGSATSSTINGVYATGAVTGGANSQSLGGLIGGNSGSTIADAYATGAVSAGANSGQLGGLVGTHSSGSLSRVYATGSVTGGGFVGGLVGAAMGNTAIIDNSYATGLVTGSSAVGGLVAYNFGSVSNSFWDTKSTGQVSSFAWGSGTGITAVTSDPAEFAAANYAFKQSAYTGFSVGNITATGTTWIMIDGQTRPFLASEYSTTIRNAHQLQLMARDIGANYTLASNIDASGTNATVNSSGMWSTAGFVPVGASLTPFSGTFTGAGKTISNLTINTGTGGDAGLFGASSGTIQNVVLSGGSVSGAYNVGALVGSNRGGTVVNAGAIGVTVTGAASGGAYNVGGLIGLNGGTVQQSYATGNVIVTSSGSIGAGGLAGGNAGNPTLGFVGLIEQSYATGAVTSAGSDVGGLVGANEGGTVRTSYATGNVTGTYHIGGLAGSNLRFTDPPNSISVDATISKSFATGGATATESSVWGTAGGLVGYNRQSSITDSYATGAATGWNVGGLVGYANSGSIDRTYATGRVTHNPAAGGGQGGILGFNLAGNGTVAHSYYDSDTTGQTGSTYGTALTTRQLQGLDPVSGPTYFSTAANLPDGLGGSAFSGGASGLYPYLTAIFPTGVRAISGFVYTDINGTTPVSGANGAVSVGAVSNGGSLSAVTIGANGYYYVAASASALSAGNSILAYTNANVSTGATNAATLTTATGATVQSGVNIYGNTLTTSTTATLLSAASTANAATLASLTAGNANAAAAVNGAAGQRLVASGASFTIDQLLPISDSFIVQTLGSAPLTVSSAVTLNGSGQLGLLAGGALAINAPVNVTGGGKVVLTAAINTTTVSGVSLLELSFARGASISYAEASPGSGTGVAGQTLTINGDSYNLIYSIAGIQALDTTIGRRDALALSLTATTTYSSYLANLYRGTFDGLGNTIADLTINSSGGASVFNNLGSQGTLRNFGVAGASAFANNLGYAGSLVGQNQGVVANVFSSAAISSNADTGGLVGANFQTGTIVNSYFTGSVASTSYAGGIAASNAGKIAQTFSTGAVTSTGYGGGLVATNDATASIAKSYATGRVTAGLGNGGGGMAAFNDGTITNSYWDTDTTGRANAIGSGATPGATGLTTASFQNNGAAGLGSAFGGGANGFYPYLKTFFPNGVQVVSGTAYTDAGVTPAASGSGGLVTVTGLISGAKFGSAAAGANGYYYVFGAPVAGNQVVVSSSGANGGATFQQNATFTASGSSSQFAGLDIYGTYLKQQAASGTTTLSALSADFVTARGSTVLPDYTNRRIDITSASGFDIDEALTANGILDLRSTTSGAITQSQAISAETIQGTTAGGNLTLTRSDNTFVRVGPTNLGAGRLSLVNSVALPTFDGTLTVSGAVTANGGISLQTPGALAINATMNAGSGNVSLTNTDAGAGITQTAGITGNTLTIASAGDVDLKSTSNSVAAIEGGTSAGHFYFFNSRAGGLTVTSNGIANTGGPVVVWEQTGNLTVSGAVNSNGADVGLWSSQGVLAINAPVTAATANVALWGQAGITQTTAGVLTSRNLLALSTGAGADIALTADNAVTGNDMIGMQADNGSVSFTNTLNIHVGGGDRVDFTGVTTFVVSSGIHTAAAGFTTLNAGGTITQSSAAGDIIFTGTLNLTAANGAITLDNANNAITNLGTVPVANGLTLVDVGGLTITGAVNVTSDIRLTTSGPLTVNNVINAGSSNIELRATGPFGDITQSAAGGVVASSVNLVAGGSVDFTAGAANNNAADIRGQAVGSFRYTDNNAPNLTVSGITSINGSIAIAAMKAGGATLTLNGAEGPEKASNGDVTLRSSGDLVADAQVIANNAFGRITLDAGGSITQGVVYGLFGAQLVATAATNVDLQDSNNAIGTFAATATSGFVKFTNSTALLIDQVGSNGITAGGDVFLSVSGNVTQGPFGKIAAGGGLGVFSTGSITLDEANAVTANFAVNAANGNASLRNDGDLKIGTVAPAGFGGVSLGSGGVLTLNSNNGSIMQGAGAGDSINVGSVRGSTGNNGSMTLTNAGNMIVSVGPITLGTGALSLVDSDNGLAVTGVVSAGGGISLQTATTLSIENTLNGGTGIVSLANSSVGSAITQTVAGVITAGTLTLATNNSNATLDVATNAVTNLGTVTLGTGALNLADGVTTLTLTGAVTANGGVAISNTGAIATAATITTNNAEIALTAGTDLTIGALPIHTVTSNGGVIALTTGANGTLTINAQLDGGVGNVFLTADDMTIAAPVRNTGSLNVTTVTAGRAITLGDAPTPAGLVIDYAGSNELNQFIGMSAFNVGKTRAGTTTAGAIQIGQAVISTDQVNLFTNGGVTQVHSVVFIGATGNGTLNVTAVDTVDLRPGVGAGRITGSISGSGHFLAYSGTTTPTSNLDVGAITTSGGEIVVANPHGTLNVVGPLTTNGGNIFASAIGTLTLGADLNSGAGSIGLLSNGGINQTAGGLIGANLLAIVCNCSPVNMALGSTTNAISGNVSLVNLSGGNINFTNSVGYTVGGIGAITYSSLGPGLAGQFDTTTYGSGPGIRTAGNSSSVTLTVGGDVAQGINADDLIETNTLNISRIAGTNPNVTLDGYDSANQVNINRVANLGTVSIGQGAFAFYNAIDLTIAGAATAGRYDVASDGNLTQAAGANIDTSGANGDINLAAGCNCSGGVLSLNANLNAGSGSVFLVADTVTQAQIGSAIIAGTLNVQVGTGATLDSATNRFAIIEAQSDGDFSATTSVSLTIGSASVASTSGFVKLTALGSGSDITVPDLPGHVVFAGTNVTLDAGHNIDVTGLVLGFGTVSLTAGNDVAINLGCSCGGVGGTDTVVNAGQDILVKGKVGGNNVSLLANRDIIDTAAGEIRGFNFRAVATAGIVNLSNSATHSVGTIAGSANGSFSYRQDGDLTIGLVGASNGIVSTIGGVTVNAGTYNLTIDTLARVIANSEIVLAGNAFFNNRGSDAVASTAGRWLIYANARGTAADYNGLDSGNTAIWNTAYPAPVTALGNRYVFAAAPGVLTFTPDNTSKIYGDVATLTYTLSGLQPGVTGAYLGDTAATAFTGTPILASAGSAANAGVSGSPYTITIAQGTVAAINSYTLDLNSFSGTGLLSVNPATLTYLADPASRTIGAPNPKFSGLVTGFVNGETLAHATTGAAVWTSPANASSPVGSYAIDGSGLSAANYVFVQALANATALTITPATNTTPPSQTNPPSSNPQNPGVNITFQNNPSGPVNVSFTTGAAPRTAANPTDVNTAGGPDSARSTNNGFNYQPISMFDPNQYSPFQLPDYADKAGPAAIFTMIARAAQSANAADFMIDGFWTGNDGAWGKGADGKPVAGRVTFSDGADKTVSPTESNGFPLEAGKTDLLALLGKGPVMLGGSGTPATWLLAIKPSDDGKGLIANDPITGRQVLLAYDAGTKTVGGVTGIFDEKSKSFVALSDAAATQQAGSPALKADSLAPLGSFTAATFFAVTVK
jgi:filamentous hemagglutinin family protein